MICILSIFYFN